MFLFGRGGMVGWTGGGSVGARVCHHRDRVSIRVRGRLATRLSTARQASKGLIPLSFVDIIGVNYLCSITIH